MKKFNNWLALTLTKLVSTMWAAYVFAILAVLGFPGFHATIQQYVQWFSQTFIQLVMLAVIMVGQQLLSEQAKTHHEALKKHITKEAK